MQELINKLKIEAGLTEEQAVKSLETITVYIKTKLPPMMHDMIDSFLGNTANTNTDNDILG